MKVERSGGIPSRKRLARTKLKGAIRATECWWLLLLWWLWWL